MLVGAYDKKNQNQWPNIKIELVIKFVSGTVRLLEELLDQKWL